MTGKTLSGFCGTPKKAPKRYAEVKPKPKAKKP